MIDDTKTTPFEDHLNFTKGRLIGKHAAQSSQSVYGKRPKAMAAFDVPKPVLSKKDNSSEEAAVSEGSPVQLPDYSVNDIDSQTGKSFSPMNMQKTQTFSASKTKGVEEIKNDVFKKRHSLLTLQPVRRDDSIEE